MNTALECGFSGWSGPQRPLVFRIPKPFLIEFITASSEADPLTPYLKLLLSPDVWTGRKGASAYKAYAAAVIRAVEHGIVQDDGTLRIGCDTRTLSEIAGMRRATLQQSALPYLVQELNLLKWKREKGRKTGVFVLAHPTSVRNRTIKVSTHFYGTVSHTPENALETLRLLIRMRSGYTKSAKLLRLGMPAMFTAIALATTPRRGQTIDELASRTGRRKTDLRRYAIARLKAAGVVREVSHEVYRLTDDFADRYEWVLRKSGITFAEYRQRQRHDEERQKRAKEMRASKQTAPLRGEREMARIIKERSDDEARNRAERERQKVGMTAAAFLADEMDGTYGCRWRELCARWRERGGKSEALQRVIHDRKGPYVFYREAADFNQLYVKHKGEKGEYAGPNARLWGERADGLHADLEEDGW